LTLIHALAAGIPTVASRTGGNGEIVTDGVTGLLFSKGEPADLARRIARLRDDSALRVRLASEARRFSRGFTFERMVDGMETYLLAGPPGTASSPGRTGGNQP
jgi:glycosyltransferase involved in cell wall biosynthesis